MVAREAETTATVISFRGAPQSGPARTTRSEAEGEVV